MVTHDEEWNLISNDDDVIATHILNSVTTDIESDNNFESDTKTSTIMKSVLNLQTVIHTMHKCVLELDTFCFEIKQTHTQTSRTGFNHVVIPRIKQPHIFKTNHISDLTTDSIRNEKSTIGDTFVKFICDLFTTNTKQESLNDLCAMHRYRYKKQLWNKCVKHPILWNIEEGTKHATIDTKQKHENQNKYNPKRENTQLTTHHVGYSHGSIQYSHLANIGTIVYIDHESIYEKGGYIWGITHMSLPITTNLARNSKHTNECAVLRQYWILLGVIITNDVTSSRCIVSTINQSSEIWKYIKHNLIFTHDTTGGHQFI